MLLSAVHYSKARWLTSLTLGRHQIIIFHLQYTIATPACISVHQAESFLEIADGQTSIILPNAPAAAITTHAMTDIICPNIYLQAFAIGTKDARPARMQSRPIRIIPTKEPLTLAIVRGNATTDMEKPIQDYARRYAMPE
jgi:hypothetical protein